jgi:O-antigen/teichoic acid export membrane protein
MDQKSYGTIIHMTEELHEDHTTTVRNTLSRNIMADISARIGYMISRFFIPPFVLAHVSLAAYGLWATAFILVSYIGVSTLGISNVYIKYVAEYAARREFDRINRLLSTGLMITIPVCVLVFAALWLAWPKLVVWLHVAPNLRRDAREVLLGVVAIFLASIGLSAYRDTLTGMQQNASILYVWVVAYLMETGLIFLLVGKGRGIRGLTEAFMIRTAFEIVVPAIMAYRRLPWLKIRPQFISRDSLRLLFSFGGVVQVTSLLAIFLNSVERAVAAPLAGLEATGLLDIGQKLPSMAASVPSAFAGAFIPAASYLQGGLEGSENEQATVRKLYLKGARYMNLSSAYICGFLAVVPGPVLDVWMGRYFAGAAYLMFIFSIATQVHLMTAPGTSILKGIGRPREEFYYAIPNLITLAIFLPLSRVVFGKWSAIGIGTAVPLATIVSAIYFLWHANRVLQINLTEYWSRVVVPGAVPYLLAAPFAYPLIHIIHHFNRIQSAGWIVLGGLIYSAAFAFTVDRLIWDTGERLWFHAVLSDKLDRILKKRSAAV